MASARLGHGRMGKETAGEAERVANGGCGQSGASVGGSRRLGAATPRMFHRMSEARSIGLGWGSRWRVRPELVAIRRGARDGIGWQGRLRGCREQMRVAGKEARAVGMQGRARGCEQRRERDQHRRFLGKERVWRRSAGQSGAAQSVGRRGRGGFSARRRRANVSGQPTALWPSRLARPMRSSGPIGRLQRPPPSSITATAGATPPGPCPRRQRDAQRASPRA
mmetsp:Transcript_36147/g.85746  ORF Transcript_36147/g.85746 Transcript_36147/m.85746 type:complete len:223 (+) Transcript_36147:1848-2516(+)